MNIPAIISAIQRVCGVTVDGKAGPETWEAIYNIIVKDGNKAPKVANLVNDFVDDRSEKNIATLKAEVQPIARALIHSAASVGITIKVISGNRTFAEQDELYAQGRTTPGSKVTNARGGFSNHNFGIAFDIGVFSGSRYVEESPAYKAVGALGKSLGLEWGGDWTSIQDEPHFQLRPKWAAGMSERDMLAELRRNQP